MQKPGLRRAWAAWAARWHWLDGKRSSMLGSIGILPLALMQGDTARAGLPQWGEPLDWRYLLRLAAFTLLALNLLQSPDLHWRRLLAPGVRRRQIGVRILWASLKGNLVILAFAGGQALALIGTLNGLHWAHILAIAAGLLPDLLLATMLAVTLRGFAGSQAASLLYLLGIAVGVALLAYVVHPAWQRDGWHALAMGALMLTLLPLLQRAWLRADLVLLAAKAKEPPEPNGWER